MEICHLFGVNTLEEWRRLRGGFETAFAVCVFRVAHSRDSEKLNTGEDNGLY